MAKRPISKKLMILVGAGIAILVAVSYLVFLPAHILSIEDVTLGKKILEIPAKPGDNLWIAFVNSVEKLPVADHFVINEDHDIIFAETIFQAPYAGYDRSEKAELIAPGTTRIAGYNRRMEAVTFFAGDRSRHMLFVNGNWVPLYETVRGGDLIRIQVKKSSKLAFYGQRMVSDE
ncbi:MAG: DUF1850 domain-containing protein [Desulfobacterales bacterium]